MLPPCVNLPASTSFPVTVQGLFLAIENSASTAVPCSPPSVRGSFGSQEAITLDLSCMPAADDALQLVSPTAY